MVGINESVDNDFLRLEKKRKEIDGDWLDLGI